MLDVQADGRMTEKAFREVKLTVSQLVMVCLKQETNQRIFYLTALLALI